MAELVVSQTPLPARYEQPGNEIGWLENGAETGIDVLTRGVNSLLGQKSGMLINDVFDPATLPLTPSDSFMVKTVRRTWAFKTPSFLGITAAANRQLTLQVFIAKSAGAGMAYQIYLNGALILTYNFTSSAISSQWITISTTISASDTVENNTLQIVQSGWHGGSHASNYARAIRLYPNYWTSVSNQNNGWSYLSQLRFPPPQVFLGAYHACPSYVIQSMQNMLNYIYARRISTLYNSSFDLSIPAATLTRFTKIRINPPQGVTNIKCFFYCVRTAGTGEIGIRNQNGDQTVASPAALGHVTMSVPVTPGRPEVWLLQARETSIFGVTIYCEDAT